MRWLQSAAMLSLVVLSSSLPAFAQLPPASSGLEFGSQPLNQAGAPQSATFKNSTAAPVTVRTLIRGDAAADFVAGGDCPASPATLAAGKSCAIRVTFTPSAAGLRTATLTISDSAHPLPQNLHLAGTGETFQYIATGGENLVSTTSGANSQNGESVLESSTSGKDSARRPTRPSASPGSGLLPGSLAPLTTTGSAIGLVSIVVTPGNSSIGAGGTQQFIATGVYSDGTTVNLTSSVGWSSSAPGVAAINGAGLATGVAQGSTVILASYAAAASPPAAKADAVKASSVTVSAPPIVVSQPSAMTGSTTFTVTAPTLVSISITPANPSIPAGSTQQFTATGNYSNNTTQNLTSTATWSSLASGVAAINSAGLASSLAAGQTTITATFGGITGSTPLIVTAGFEATSGSMTPGRAAQTATLLENGSVLIAGGEMDRFGDPTSTDWLYDPAAGTFVPGGSLNSPRAGHTATLLSDGTVLVAGGWNYSINYSGLSSGELYDPATGNFSYTPGGEYGGMNQSRWDHTATLLPNGQVLMAGGSDSPYGYPLSNAELYNPASQTFSFTPGGLNTGRYGHTATLLNNGLVLIAGGDVQYNSSVSTNTAELYNPATGAFSYTANPAGGGQTYLNYARYNHTATLLNNGMVLIAGGYGCNGSGCTPAPVANAELYDPNTQTFTTVGTMNVARYDHAATVLSNGMVLLAGGYGCSGSGCTAAPLTSAELYDPASGNFVLTGNLQNARYAETATLLNNGQVFIAGGENIANGNDVFLGSAEIYSPATMTPPNLVSVALAPNNPIISLGGSVQFTATGTFSDGASEQLTSIIWTSSNPGAVSVSSDASNAGAAFALAGSSATITACAGAICGSTPVTVGPALVSITVTPAVQTIPISASTQYSAIGNYSDGSTQNLTSAVTWTTSNPSVATVNDLPGSMGLAATACSGASATCAGTTTINATLGTVMGSAALTVEPDVAYTGKLVNDRTQHTATLLNNGLVLLAGGCQADNVCPLSTAELYDPATGTFTLTGSLNVARYNHTATLLPNGMVLIAGGCVGGYCTPTGSAELYNPATGTFTLTGSLNTARNGHTATLLPNGQVLMAGGGGCYYQTTSCPLQSAELYNPTTGTFAYTSGYNANPLAGGSMVQTNMQSPRVGHTATLLPNGLVVITGGYAGSSDISSSAEVYCSVNVGPCSTSYFLGSFEPISGLHYARADHTATMLDNGSVLIAGGTNGSSPVGETELLGPGSSAFGIGAPMVVPRYGHTATALTNGLVLIAGGAGGNTQECELFNSAAGAFTLTGELNTEFINHTATLLSNGTVLLAGGSYPGEGGASDILQAELYTPATLTPAGLVSITVTPATFALTLNASQTFTATGAFSNGNSEQLAGVFWTSSNPGVVSVSNDPSDPGAGYALGSGAATLTACAGSVCGSASITVAPQLLSISISPSSDTLPVGSQLQFYASGVYSDGTTHDVTSLATWSSSAPAFAIITAQGLATGMSGGGTTITAALGAVQGQALLDVAAGVIGQTAATGALNYGRVGHTSTMLNLGQVLVAGGYDSTGYVAQAELYSAGSFSTSGVGSLNTPRYGHTATLLDNGQVLIAGGFANGYVQCSAELYTPPTETFAYTNGGPAIGLNTPRYAHTATMLPNGLVLIAGGIDSTGYPTASAELFDRTTQTFTPTGSLTLPRFWHTATLLPNGLVLIAGGSDENNDPISSAEIYNPNTGVFTPAGALSTARFLHTATLLNNGLVLFAGGFGGNGFLTSAEVYNFATGTFRPTGSLHAARDGHTATLLTSGSVLLAGGQNQSYLSSEEVYDPNSETFTVSANLPVAEAGATATLLADGSGDVLIAGGAGDGGYFDTASLYQPATLTPPGLVSISVTQALPDLSTSYIGLSSQTTQRVAAIGTFSDGSTEALNAVTWSSSNTNLVRISNDATDPGTGLDITGSPSASSVTITAAAGSISATTTLNLRSSGFVYTQNQAGAQTSLNSARNSHTATLLNNGQVLLAGGTYGGPLASAELYNPATGTFTETGSMNTPREDHTATLLNNGMVLIAGGLSTNPLASAELYNPATGAFTYTGNMVDPRYSHTATLLNNGMVLIAGGSNNTSGILNTAELYDPASGTFTSTGTMNSQRVNHTATLLANGLVLLAGGIITISAEPPTNTAELYDPITGAFTPTGNMNTPRYWHTATLLTSGMVLIVGGADDANGDATNTAELFNPATGAFVATASLGVARESHTATLLNNGMVLIAGGINNSTGTLASAALYSPAAGTFSSAGTLNNPRAYHTATLLTNGMVLLAAGYGPLPPPPATATYVGSIASAELY